MIKYNFDNSKNDFFKEIKEKVDQYFEEKGISKTGNSQLYIKGIIQILSAGGLYTWLVFFTPTTPLAIGLCALLGINLALLGFNIMHEGGHNAFSKHSWVNKIGAYFLNILGGNSYFWKIKHNVNHHTFTNVEGMDNDINVKPFMRLHEGQPYLKMHRFQHLYWFLLYGQSYLAWVFYEDFHKYFSGKITVNAQQKSLPAKEHAIFWFSKLMFVMMYMVVPMLFVGWLPWMIGFVTVMVVCGLSIAVVFQLAHVVEGTNFHTALEEKQESLHSWAIHQVQTTANFATKNKVLHWLLGGLNFQIEHHLFPRISHVHYPAISPIIKEVCDKYDIVYNEYQSMLQAIYSHLMHLKKLGQPEPIRVRS